MFVQPFEFPILNKRVIVLEKNITHKSRNFSQKQGMNIRLNIFGDYNNKFGVLTRNISVVTKEEEDDDNNGKKRMFNPGFHNKILCNIFKKDKKEDKEVLFSRINLRKHNSISTVVLNSEMNKHKASENNINIHHHNQHKHKKKKAVSIITDRKPEEILIRNLYLNNNNNERKKDIKTLLTVKKIPKEIFRNTLQSSPKVQFNNQNKHMLRYFNSHSINNNNTLLSTNEYFKRK